MSKFINYSGLEVGNLLVCGLPLCKPASIGATYQMACDSCEKGRAMAEMGVPEDIRSSVAIANVKSVAEQPALLSNLAFGNLVANVNLSQQNAVSHQQAMTQLMASVVTKAVNQIANLSPKESLAINKLDYANDLVPMLQELTVTMSMLKESMKKDKES